MHVVEGDGNEGVPTSAPYDVILVSAAFPQVPEALASQLRIGGRLVQPIGPGGAEQVTVFERSADGLVSREVVCHARFVRLYGRHGSSGRSVSDAPPDRTACGEQVGPQRSGQLDLGHQPRVRVERSRHEHMLHLESGQREGSGLGRSEP